MSNRRQKITFFVVAIFFLIFQPFDFDFSNFDPNHQNAGGTGTVFGVEKQRAFAYEQGESSLVTKVLTGTSEDSTWVKKFYNTCLAIFNILIVAILIFIAIANILRINIGTYEIKKLIPPFLYAVLFANLAFPIFVILSKFVDSLGTISLFTPRSYGIGYMYQGGGTEKLSISALAETLGAIIVGNITGLGALIGLAILLGGMIVGILLSLTFSFRPYIIFLLAAISPIAIACLVLPQTEKYFKKWLSAIIIWFFLPIMAYAVINIGYEVPTSMSLDGDGFVSSIVGVYLPLLIRCGLLLLAIRIPFSLEKDISGLIQRVGKWTGGRAMALPGYVGSWQKNPMLSTWAKKDPNAPGAKWHEKARIGAARQLVGAGKWATKGATAGDLLRPLGAVAGAVKLKGVQGSLKTASDRLDSEFARLGPGLSVMPIAQLSNFSAYRKLAIEKQKKREYEAALDALGMNPIDRESHFRFHYEDNRGMYDDSSYDEISAAMGLEIDPKGKLIGKKADGEYEINKAKFIAAAAKGNFGKAGDNKSILGKAMNAVRKAGGNVNDMEQVYQAFLGQNFAQTDSQSTWFKAFTLLERDGKDDDDFVEFIHALKAKQRASKSYFSPESFIEVALETEAERDDRIRRKTGRGGPGPVPSGSPGETGGDQGETGEDAEDYGAVAARRDAERLRSGFVDLSPTTISALADTMVAQRAISSEPEQLSRAFAKEFAGMRKSMAEMGLDDESIDAISVAVKQGNIKSDRDLVRYLPQGIANKSKAVFERLAMSQSSKALAYSAAGSSDIAQNTRTYAQRMAGNYADIAQSTRGGIDIYEAADKLSLQENGLASLSQAEIDSAKQTIATALNISTQAVNQRVAQSTARAFEALGTIPGDKTNITIQTPELVQATASQQIRDDLAISATKQISDAVKNSIATSKPISAESLGSITGEIQTVLDLQLQISKPNVSGITDQIKRNIAADITRQLVSRDFSTASEQSVLSDVQKLISEAKDKF